MLSIFDKIKSTLFVKRASIVLIRRWLHVRLKRIYAKIRKYETKYACFSRFFSFVRRRKAKRVRACPHQKRRSIDRSIVESYVGRRFDAGDSGRSASLRITILRGNNSRLSLCRGKKDKRRTKKRLVYSSILDAYRCIRTDENEKSWPFYDPIRTRYGKKHIFIENKRYVRRRSSCSL